MDVIDKNCLVGRSSERLGMAEMVFLEMIFNISILCGYENSKTNLSRSEQSTAGQHYGCTPSFNLSKSQDQALI